MSQIRGVRAKTAPDAQRGTCRLIIVTDAGANAGQAGDAGRVVGCEAGVIAPNVAVVSVPT